MGGREGGREGRREGRKVGRKDKGGRVGGRAGGRTDGRVGGRSSEGEGTREGECGLKRKREDKYMRGIMGEGFCIEWRGNLAAVSGFCILTKQL